MYIIDALFLLDMIMIFNTAFYDEQFKIIDDRKIIAIIYIK